MRMTFSPSNLFVFNSVKLFNTLFVAIFEFSVSNPPRTSLFAPKLERVCEDFV